MKQNSIVMNIDDVQTQVNKNQAFLSCHMATNMCSFNALVRGLCQLQQSVQCNLEVLNGRNHRKYGDIKAEQVTTWKISSVVMVKAVKGGATPSNDSKQLK